MNLLKIFEFLANFSQNLKKYFLLPPLCPPTAKSLATALIIWSTQGRPDRGPRAQIWAPDRLFLGPLGLKYMH